MSRDVNSYSSHVSGGASEGCGWKLGLCRGEGASGDHDINLCPVGIHDDDEWELSSPGSSVKMELGSTFLCPSCAFWVRVWTAGPPGPAGNTLPFWTSVIRVEAVRSPGSGDTEPFAELKPDLSIAQLRAPLVVHFRFPVRGYAQSYYWRSRGRLLKRPKAAVREFLVVVMGLDGQSQLVDFMTDVSRTQLCAPLVVYFRSQGRGSTLLYPQWRRGHYWKGSMMVVSLESLVLDAGLTGQASKNDLESMIRNSPEEGALDRKAPWSKQGLVRSKWRHTIGWKNQLGWAGRCGAAQREPSVERGTYQRKDPLEHSLFNQKVSRGGVASCRQLVQWVEVRAGSRFCSNHERTSRGRFKLVSARIFKAIRKAPWYTGTSPGKVSGLAVMGGRKDTQGAVLVVRKSTRPNNLSVLLQVRGRSRKARNKQSESETRKGNYFRRGGRPVSFGIDNGRRSHALGHNVRTYSRWGVKYNEASILPAGRKCSKSDLNEAIFYKGDAATTDKSEIPTALSIGSRSGYKGNYKEAPGLYVRVRPGYVNNISLLGDRGRTQKKEGEPLATDRETGTPGAALRTHRARKVSVTSQGNRKILTSIGSVISTNLGPIP